MSDLLSRLKKVSSLDDTSVLSESSFFVNKDVVPTDVPTTKYITLGPKFFC